MSAWGKKHEESLADESTEVPVKKVFKYEVGYWHSMEPEGVVEAENEIDANIAAHDLMLDLTNEDKYDLEPEIDTYPQIEEWGDCPVGKDVEYMRVSISQDFWMRPV